MISFRDSGVHIGETFPVQSALPHTLAILYRSVGCKRLTDFGLMLEPGESWCRIAYLCAVAPSGYCFAKAQRIGCPAGARLWSVVLFPPFVFVIHSRTARSAFYLTVPELLPHCPLIIPVLARLAVRRTDVPHVPLYVYQKGLVCTNANLEPFASEIACVKAEPSACRPIIPSPIISLAPLSRISGYLCPIHLGRVLCKILTHRSACRCAR